MTTGKYMKFTRIYESDNFIVDYDTKRKLYRVSYFENGHFKDECWFDAYEEKCDIVRCKDCDLKHYSDSGNLWCDIFDKIMDEGSYCSLGEK